MIFNKAKTEDIPALVALRKAYLAEDYGHLSEEDTATLSQRLPHYYSSHLGRDLFIYTAREDGEIVSCCFLLVVEKPSNPSFPKGRVGDVLNVYTKPSHRRRGCAYTLMSRLLAEAAALDLDFVELKATGDGYPLYRKLGFEEEISRYRHMKWVADHHTVDFS